METIKNIYQRRSIRKFKKDEVPNEVIEKVLEVAVQAPSGKNRQPWSFVVLRGQKKNELIKIMTKKLKKLKKVIDIGSAEKTVKSINQAPVIILVFNTGMQKSSDINTRTNYKWLIDIQSIGAAVLTMILAAEDMGLGTLWTCDIYYTDKEICDYVKKTEELIAAVALGYPDESPKPRPRKEFKEITEWLE